MPYLLPASAKPRLEAWGLLTTEGEKHFVLREEVIFEEPKTVEDLMDLVYHQKQLADLQNFKGLVEALPPGA